MADLNEKEDQRSSHIEGDAPQATNDRSRTGSGESDATKINADDGGAATNILKTLDSQPLTKYGTIDGDMATYISRAMTSKSHDVVLSEAVILARKCLGRDDLNDRESRDFRAGAVLAWDNAPRDDDEVVPDHDVPVLTEIETRGLADEASDSRRRNFSQLTGSMWLVAVVCGMAAIVQGMDQSAVNGAQVGYKKEFNITNEWEEGLINGAPYLCCLLLGCWSSAPLNKRFGRKGTIAVSCVWAIISGIWQMCVHSKWELFAARFVMGFAIGAKSSTTPAFSAECAPPKVRGALGTQWQMWTAFGIALGLAVCVPCLDIRTSAWGANSGWRIILGSTAAPAVILIVLLPFVPESPRWYLARGNYRKAYKSLCKLRKCSIQATRDLYEIETKFRHEREWKEAHPETSMFKSAFKLFTVPRNRRAAQSGAFCLFMQQFCGVNVIAYYSTDIFKDAGADLKSALLFSFGAGLINWIFAIPGTLTIDKYGRRTLLLWTFPVLAVCLFFTGFSFYAPNDEMKKGLVGTGIYLFMVFYSPGMGPVPFSYAAEAYPLEVRDIGMSFATAVCWGFNFIIALTFPAMKRAFTIQGAFSFYAAWCLIAWCYVWFYLPETANLPLEALDKRFNVPFRTFARLNWYQIPWNKKKPLPEDLEEVKHIMTHVRNPRVIRSIESQQEAGEGCGLYRFRHALKSRPKATRVTTGGTVRVIDDSGDLDDEEKKEAEDVLHRTRTSNASTLASTARARTSRGRSAGRI